LVIFYKKQGLHCANFSDRRGRHFLLKLKDVFSPSAKGKINYFCDYSAAQTLSGLCAHKFVKSLRKIAFLILKKTGALIIFITIDRPRKLQKSERDIVLRKEAS
jgi:hypothetical protein